MVKAEYVKITIKYMGRTRQLVPSDVERYQTPKENSLWFTVFVSFPS